MELLGATPEAIHKAEDRETFKAIMDSIGVESAKSRVARSLEDGKKIIQELGLPLILRPSFTLGGEGGGTADTEEEFLTKLERALFLSPTKDCLVEESLIGWKEFELEVVRDKRDNVIIVCSIENFDPMGVHTGDSITVAPAQTLTDREYQNLRDQSVRIIRAIGVETGGSNIQFTMNPIDGRVLVIEMNPRVSRSSALASKATGFPIARVAAKTRGRLYPRRTHERHHEDHPLLVRTIDRLRRDEDPAFRFRQVSPIGSDPYYADEIRRRNDGHGPHFRGISRKSARRAGN